MNIYGYLDKYSRMILRPFGRKGDYRAHTMCGLFWQCFGALLVVMWGLIGIVMTPEILSHMLADIFFDNMTPLSYMDSVLEHFPVPLALVVFPSLLAGICLSAILIIATAGTIAAIIIVAAVGIYAGIKWCIRKLLRKSRAVATEPKKPSVASEMSKALWCSTRSVFRKVKCKWYVDYNS